LHEDRVGTGIFGAKKKGEEEVGRGEEKGRGEDLWSSSDEV